MTLALSLFLCWLSLWLWRKFQPEASQTSKYMLLLLLAPFVLYPFVYSPVWYIRGFTGDLSILSLILLMSALQQQLFGTSWVIKQDRLVLERSVVVVGLCFYPLALGLGTFDPYVLGYGHIGFIIALVCAAVTMLFFANRTIAVILMLAIASWNMQLLQSVNLWDYLIDPFIFFYYFGRVVRRRTKNTNGVQGIG